MKVVTAEQMQQIDRKAADMGLTTSILMENAGRLVAEEIKKYVDNIIGRHMLILVGPGNNGGDGLVAARYLNDWGAEVNIYMCSDRSSDDNNMKLAQDRNIPVLNASDDTYLSGLEQATANSELIVDAIFGTGRSRTIDGIFQQILMKVTTAKYEKPELAIISIDLPSGLDANNGAVDPSCLSADFTVTLGYPKPGLYSFPGAEKAGKVKIVDIGIPPSLSDDIIIELLTEEWVKSAVPKRPAGANKGSFGKVLVVAGSINYIGAAYLACMGAYRVGAGLVTLCTLKNLQPILASKLTEVTYLLLPENKTGMIAPEAAAILKQHIPEYDVVLIGCGLGTNTSITQLMELLLPVLAQSCPLVLDADALNIIAEIPDWWHRLGNNVILTPHPGEMSRLTKIDLDEIQHDRLEVTRKAARDWQKIVVLKGAYTIISSPDGHTKISQEANPGLASAGTGDILSGVIAGLLAQGLSSYDAATCGVYLHAMAGNLVRHDLGDAGMLASDLLPALPRVIKSLKEH